MTDASADEIAAAGQRTRRLAEMLIQEMLASDVPEAHFPDVVAWLMHLLGMEDKAQHAYIEIDDSAQRY